SAGSSSATDARSSSVDRITCGSASRTRRPRARRSPKRACTSRCARRSARPCVSAPPLAIPCARLRPHAGRGAAWLARQSGGLEVPSSNLGAPMKAPRGGSPDPLGSIGPRSPAGVSVRNAECWLGDLSFEPEGCECDAGEGGEAFVHGVAGFPAREEFGVEAVEAFDLEDGVGAAGELAGGSFEQALWVVDVPGEGCEVE